MTLLADPAIYTWGPNPSPYPIQLPFDQYYGRYLYQQDFLNADGVSCCQITATSQCIGHPAVSLDNSARFYSGGMAIDYYFLPSDGGLDWEDLYLVFDHEGQTWYLVAIIHDEWTP